MVVTRERTNVSMVVIEEIACVTYFFMVVTRERTNVSMVVIEEIACVTYVSMVVTREIQGLHVCDEGENVSML